MPNRTIQPLLIACTLLLLFAIALFGIQRESLWLDESWSAWTVYDTPRDLDGLRDTLRFLRDSALTTLERVRDDMHPPLYFFLLEGTTLLLGESEFALRLPSALAGLLGLATTFAIGRQWLGWKGGLFALVLLGTAGFFLYYAREARMYALLLACAALATRAYTRWWRRGGLWRGLVYALLLTFALYTHYLAALLIPIHLLHHLLTRPRWRIPLPYALTALLFAPWLPILWQQWQAHPGGPMSSYLPGNLDTLAGFGLAVSSGYGSIFLLPFLLGTAVPDALRKPRERRFVGLVVLWLLLPLLSLLLLNAPERALLQLRYVLLSLPAWALLIGYGLAQVRIPLLPWMLLAWMVFTQLTMMDDLWQSKPPWREAVQHAATTRDSAEPALIHIPPHSPTAYYDRRFGLQVGISLDIGWRSFSPAEVREAAAALQNAASVWAFLPAQDPSSWDALAALYQGRGIGYRYSVQGALFYRFEAGDFAAESADELRQLRFTFGELLDYEGGIVTAYTVHAGEVCVPLRLRARAAVPDSYSIGLYLTQGYHEVLAQRDELLGAVDAGERIERDLCLSVPSGLPSDDLHLRLVVYQRETLQRLPLLESGLLWGDYLLVGRTASENDH